MAGATVLHSAWPKHSCPSALPAVFLSLPRWSQRQMGVSDVRTGVELAHGAAEADAAALDDVGTVGNQFCEMQVLFGDDDADAFLLHGQDGVDHLLHDLRRQSLRWFVEQHQRRVSHQGPRDRQYLLL